MSTLSAVQKAVREAELRRKLQIAGMESWSKSKPITPGHFVESFQNGFFGDQYMSGLMIGRTYEMQNQQMEIAKQNKVKYS